MTERQTRDGAVEDDLDRLRLPSEALAIVLAHSPLLPVEQVPLIDAIGRVLGDDVIAEEDFPAFRASTMDGFAVIADDDSPWREIVGAQMAGPVHDYHISLGTAVRIMTGAPVPDAATAVIPIEKTEAADDHIVVQDDSLKAGDNIRGIGADMRSGEVVLKSGTILGPAEIGLVAGLGRVPVPVRRRARVSILSTGNELVEPDQPIQPGQIRDSNRFSLVAALSGAGAEVVWSGKAPDDREQLRRFFQDRVRESDIVVTSGGVSMGDLDLVKQLLSDVATVHFRRIKMKPGKPLNFATVDTTLIFGLPGNPVSALVSFEIFIRSALAKMTGQTVPVHPRVPVLLAQGIIPSDRIEYQRATVEVGADGRLVAMATGGQASSRLSSFVGANALLEIPPRATPFRSGERVDALMLSAPTSSSHGAVGG